MIRYQDSFDNEMINEDTTSINSNIRPSIFYPSFTKFNEKTIQMNRATVKNNKKPWLTNLHRYVCRFWFCLSGDTKYKRFIRKRTSRFGINSRSELDVCARILFPLSFVLFNILYWFYFLHLQQ